MSGDIMCAKANLRFIGDVHGHKERYLHLLRKAESSIQVGDVGFDYEFLSNTDHSRHKFLGGNHDNYDKIRKCPNYLGNYGTHVVEGFGEIFFVRGAYSIDMHLRTEGVSWWRDEQLSTAEGYGALAEYQASKPETVVTHECPLSIVKMVTDSNWIKTSRTNQLLQAMFEAHQPRLWIFGHYHKSWRLKVGQTTFVCLNELECFDF